MVQEEDAESELKSVPSPEEFGFQYQEQRNLVQVRESKKNLRKRNRASSNSSNINILFNSPFVVFTFLVGYGSCVGNGKSFMKDYEGNI